jgi:hypothetical protein
VRILFTANAVVFISDFGYDIRIHCEIIPKKTSLINASLGELLFYIALHNKLKKTLIIPEFVVK